MNDQRPKQRDQYTLTIRDAGGPDEGPAMLRLRSLLKRMLRSFAFRCVSITPAVPAEDDQGGVEANEDHMGSDTK